MASLQAIREGIRGRLATVHGLNVYAVVPDSVAFPCAIVGGPEEIEFDYTMARFTDRWVIPVRVLTGRVDEVSGQQVLDGYLNGSGQTSIKAAVEGDLSLNGAANTCRVTKAGGYGIYTMGGVQSVGMEFTIEVIA